MPIEKVDNSLINSGNIFKYESFETWLCRSYYVWFYLAASGSKFWGKSNKTWHFVKLNMTRMLFSFVEWPRETSFLSVKSGNWANNCHLWKNFSFRVAAVAPRHLAESHFADRLLSYNGDSKTRKILVLSWVNLVFESYTLKLQQCWPVANYCLSATRHSAKWLGADVVA